MRYKSDDYIPTDVLCSRAHELVNAIITNGGRCPREFTMRIPAERDRDADLVISEIARRLQKTEVERNALLAELADVKKLASDFICDNQGLKHKIDIMQNQQQNKG